MTIAVNVYVDWDNDGAFTTTGDDISAYVKTASWRIGLGGRFDAVARGGQCSVILDNSTRYFSPDNTASPYYGKFKPNVPIRIDATNGTTAWTVFRGVVTAFFCDSGDRGRREAELAGEDYVGLLSRLRVNLPLRQSVTTDAAIKLITSAAFRSAVATGTVTLDAAPTNGETVTIGTTTYTFVSSGLDSAYKVLIGSSATACALNLAACINAAFVSTEQGYEAATVYGNAGVTTKHPDVTAYAEVLDGASGGTTTIAPVAGTGDAFVGKFDVGYVRQEAQGFQVAVSGTLTQITVTLGALTAGAPGDMTWEVCADSGGVPGAILQSGSWTPTVNAVNTIAVTGGVSLATGVQYWLVLHLTVTPLGIAYYTWKFGTGNYAGGNNAIQTNSYPWLPITAYDNTCSITTGAIVGAKVTITAAARGAWGNAIALAESAAAITLSDATLAGGVDGPSAALLDLNTGTITLTEIGAGWSEDKTNGLSAVEEVVLSEGTALFWGAADGKLTFRNRHWESLLNQTAASLTLDGEMADAPMRVLLDDVLNRVTVRYTPETTRASGVVAKSDQTIEVPGTTLRRTSSGAIERYNLTDNLPDPTNTAFVRLSFVDTETGQVTGAESLVLPLVANTDFDINDIEDGSGTNYTSLGYVRFDVALSGTGVEVTMQNSALGQLYVDNLQVRGVAKIAYDPVNVQVEDSTSIAAYGVRPYDVELPLMFSGIDTFAPQLAAHLLSRNAYPTSRQEALSFQNMTAVDAVNLYSLDLGDVLTVSEAQTGVTARKAWIAGISGSIAQGNRASLAWNVRHIDSGYVHLILDDLTYGQLDDNRLAL
jgi:hypothetical protein